MRFGTKMGGELVGDDDVDSRLIRRMIRRSVSNKSSRNTSEIENNVTEKEVIEVDDYVDDEYATYLDRKSSGIPRYVDHLDGRYDGNDVDKTNVDKSSGGKGNKCEDDGNAEANKYADDDNAEASDAFLDPEYKLFMDNVRGGCHGMVLCHGNEIITYSDGYSDDDGESYSAKKPCDSRTVDTEAKRSSKGFQKRGRMSVDGNRYNRDNQVGVGPRDNHNQATESSKSKIEGSKKGVNKCGMALAENDPEYDLALNSVAVDASSWKSVAGHCKKVRYSQDKKNQSDAVLESNKHEKNSGVKLRDSGPQCNLLSAMVVDGRNEESMTKPCNKIGCGEDEKNESDEEVTILEWDPSSGGERTPFVSSKTYDVFVDGHKIPDSGGSEYREELIEYLKKPYAKDEYSQLMEEVSRRKQVERDIDLRSGPKPFKLPAIGKSYLDLHEDLHSMITEAKSDQLKVLNILRGFFFWLQNITREGAFRPWMDPSILDITPQV